MASGTLVSVEEYLRTTYKPNCEYIDGVLRPKALGTTDHARLQKRIALLLEQLGYDSLVELTVPIGPARYLIPDVAADKTRIASPYPDRPVLLCVEVLSPGDRLGATLSKCEDYHAWGVPYCWVIDPEQPRAWEYHRDGVPESRTDSLRAGDIIIQMSELYEGNG